MLVAERGRGCRGRRKRGLGVQRRQKMRLRRPLGLLMTFCRRHVARVSRRRGSWKGSWNSGSVWVFCTTFSLCVLNQSIRQHFQFSQERTHDIFPPVLTRFFLDARSAAPLQQNGLFLPAVFAGSQKRRDRPKRKGGAARLVTTTNKLDSVVDHDLDGMGVGKPCVPSATLVLSPAECA